jgi:hypothetical protein
VSEKHAVKCLVCADEFHDNGAEVKFHHKQLTVCSTECADKFNANPIQYAKAALISILIGVSANPALASSSDEAYQMISTERAHLMTRYDVAARDVDDLQKQIAVLRHDTSREAERAESELDKQLSYKNRELQQLEFQIRDLDDAMKSAPRGT